MAMPRWSGRWLLAMLATIGLFCSPGLAQTPMAASPVEAVALKAEQGGSGVAWTSSWASAQMRPDAAASLPIGGDITLHQVVRLSVGGSRVRIRLSNAFGDRPLQIASVKVGEAVAPGSTEVIPSSERAVQFGGRADIVVPPGGEYLSDAVDLAVRHGGDLAVRLHLPDVPQAQTGHPGARATSVLWPSMQVDAVPQLVERWYFLAGVEVMSPEASGVPARAIAVFGDSITDGYGVTADTNMRWPDELARRLAQRTPGSACGVINLGIGGNRVLLDGLGPNAVARFERDVLSQANVSHAIVLIGVNDLGVLTRDGPATPEAHAALVAEMTTAFGQMAAKARQRGIVVIGATIMPFAGSGYYHPGPDTEADRQAVNDWIRSPGHFDAVIDFDRIMRDPARLAHLNPAYDSGDGLHPSVEGYRAMADAVPLEMFE